MSYSLRAKLTASFGATALICVLMISLISNIQLEKHFKEYVRLNHEKENEEIADLVSAKWIREGRWDVTTLEDVGRYAAKKGLMLTIKDAQGKILWDAYANHPETTIPAVAKSEAIKKSYGLKQGDTVIGSVDMTYYDAMTYSDIDLHFIQTLNHVFVTVGLASLMIAIGLGAMLSKRISMPISRVIQTAQAIARGHYAGRIDERFSTREIHQLTETVNHLALTLEQQEILRKRLTGDVAHELRTPLTTLQTHLEAMIDGVWEPSPERLESCHEEITRITRLVSDLERLAHYESENLTLQKTHFEAEAFLSRLLLNFEGSLSQKGVQSELVCDDSVFYADKDKLSQVVINLVANALKFTPEGGRIQIDVKDLGDQTQLRVTDTGLGIDPKDLPNIFERFYRADVSRNRSTGGAGIGLTLVKAIAEAHGGSVAVASELDKGTVFTVKLPKA